MSTTTTKKPPATHIRFTDRIEAMLAEASDRTGLPKSEIVRITTSIGLRYLAAINYDIDGGIETSHWSPRWKGSKLGLFGIGLGATNATTISKWQQSMQFKPMQNIAKSRKSGAG